MPLPIVRAGDPVLRQQARPLTPEEIRSPRIRRLIEQMRETMRKAPGVGLAAPQIGESLQLLVLEDAAELQRELPAALLAEMQRVPIPFQVLINPVILERSTDTRVFFEGCLSVPGYRALVPRHANVRVRARNEQGEEVEMAAAGWYARIIQHEVDHLGGMLCIDRMWPRSLCTTEAYNEVWLHRSIAEAIAAFEADPGR
ncbi:MAG: peptide deformylase [Candidatus Xenobia bacterium]